VSRACRQAVGTTTSTKIATCGACRDSGEHIRLGPSRVAHSVPAGRLFGGAQVHAIRFVRRDAGQPRGPDGCASRTLRVAGPI
jgi:hypothetical protein